MPLHDPDKTCAFENCRDLLDKLDREIGRYNKAAEGDNLTDLRDFAFDICLTAWQLCDWVFAEMTHEQRTKLGVSKLEDLQNLALADRAVRICRQVATASKHLKVSNQHDPTVAITVTKTRDRWQIFFDDGSGCLPALYVFDLALEFWTQLIVGNGIGGAA